MITYCNSCVLLVDATEEGRFLKYDGESGGEFVLVACPQCRSPALVYREDVGYDEYHHQAWGDPVQLYPQTTQGLGSGVPPELRRAYEEAVKCFRFGVYDACSVMCRKTIEGLCRKKNAGGSNLASNLKKLRESDIIDARLYSWADMLRVVGNEAAHDIDLVSTRENASDVLDFTRALLEYVFTFEQRFEEFQARRTAKAPGGAD